MSDNAPTIPWSAGDGICPESKHILRLVGRASQDFGLVEPDDHILVACSGGKDSYTLAWALYLIARRVPFPVKLTCLNLDPGFDGFRQSLILDYLREQGVSVVGVRGSAEKAIDAKMKPGDNPCWLCARLRRGQLYTEARKLGANKLALGHHADDSIETLLINMLYASQIKAMPPKLLNDDGSMVVIRPLIYVREAPIIQFAQAMGFPTTGCGCPHERFSLDSKRAEIKQLIARLDERVPDVREHLLAAMTRVKPSHLLDQSLYDFTNFKRK